MILNSKVAGHVLRMGIESDYAAKEVREYIEMLERDNEAIRKIRKDALIEAAQRFEGGLPFNWVCADGYSNGLDIGGELRFMADEI